MSRPQAFPQSRSSTHPDVAALEHDHILATAASVLTRPVSPITSIPAPRTPGTPHDFYSEPENFFPNPASSSGPWLQDKPAQSNLSTINPAAFTAQRDAVYLLGNSVAALTAAFVVTQDEKYAARAAEHLHAWFLTPATRMTPNLPFGQHIPNTTAERFEGVLETVPLAEVARSLRFLENSNSMSAADLKDIRAWFAEYSQWLNDSRTGGLARDQKDHHGSSWLLQCAAYADAISTGLTSDDAALNALRHRFKTATLRAQLVAAGSFPREVSTPVPYRNSLFNLDLLALATELLTTRFDDPWQYELQDGPGMRAAMAFHYPFMLDRSHWPYPADAAHFKELPSRRVSLLLAGRAYGRPEYTDLWKSLQPLSDTAALELRRTFPASQPLLWFTRTPARQKP